VLVVEPVSAQKLCREEPPVVATDLVLHDLCVQHLRHVGCSLLGVARDECRVACRLWHLHAPVVGERCRDGAEHEDDAPYVVGLRDQRRRRVFLVGRRRVRVAKAGGHHERDDGAEEDAEALHGAEEATCSEFPAQAGILVTHMMLPCLGTHGN
jgi:hypothetical protein